MNQYKHPISQTQLREQNLSTILYALKAKAPLSRARLADLTQLNKSTVSSLTEELLEMGLICESGLAASGGGRPGKLLELRAGGGYVVGVEFGTAYISAVLTNFVGEIVAQSEVAIDPDQLEDALQAAIRLIHEMIAQSCVEQEAVFGIGVALSGIIDSENGRLIYSPNTQWRQIPVQQLFESAFSLPVLIENNANAAALGEYFFGAAQLVENFIFVSIGKGIGAGLFLNGQLFRGVGGLSGEIGQSHVVKGEQWLSEQDSKQRNRWDTVANKEALITLIQAQVSSQPEAFETNGSELLTAVTLPAISRAAEAQHPLVLASLQLIGERIGLGIANLAHLLDPALILIGGEMAIVAEHLLPHIDHIMQMSDLIERPFPTQIAVSAFGRNAIVMGASTLIIQNMMNEPKKYKERLNQHPQQL